MQWKELLLVIQYLRRRSESKREDLVSMNTCRAVHLKITLEFLQTHQGYYTNAGARSSLTLCIIMGQNLSRYTSYVFIFHHAEPKKDQRKQYSWKQGRNHVFTSHSQSSFQD